ncbi:MAG: class I adenylate cyclase [Chromatiales bacterium]
MAAQASRQISFEDGISRKDLSTIRDRYLKLHRTRLERILGELSPSKQGFIRLLPLLFHINHPMLPGFVRSDTPQGIPNYNPAKPELDAARRLSRSFHYQRRAQRQYQIEGLYLMGSTGSIAQSSSSDFDLWLCHGPGLNEGRRQQLQQKATLVEQAAAEQGLELHVFVIDPEAFRRGYKAKLSSESSGSTQHSLLLEEFYRSGVLLAGRYPLWWLVPPDREHEYRSYADTLLRHRFVQAGDVLDLGGLEQVSADEFFGSAHWQLYKGIDSPYKSILKIFLMEAYSRDYPRPLWLAQQAKAAVYRGVTDPDELDAYILLYRRVEAYLTEIEDSDRLELARRCFYFKVGERLSQNIDLHHWRRASMFQLVRHWGWSQADLQMLDARPSWKIQRVIRERNLLVGVLSRSYRLLTDFARNYADQSRIDPMELNLLGRKLHTALDHRPGKIDQINPGISQDLAESHLSLHRHPSRDGHPAWMLYLGTVDEQQAVQQRPIKITEHLIEMLLWSHINRVWGRYTRVSLYPQAVAVSRNELLELYRSLVDLFPTHAALPVDMKALSRPAAVVRLVLFINIGTDPLEHLSKSGKQLTSNRHDPLSFSSAQTNLALNFEELLQTSWGELLITQRQGEAGLLDALCNALNMYDTEAASAPRFHAYSFSSIRGDQIAARVDELFNHIVDYFTDPARRDSRYVFGMGKAYFIVQRESDGYTWRRQDGFEGLLEELSRPQSNFRSLSFDPEILDDTPYPALYRLNRAGLIQVFFHILPEQMQIYLLDEQGALFRQTLAVDSPRYLMLQQRRFLNSLQQLRNLLPGAANVPLKEPAFYQLRREYLSGWTAEARKVPLSRPDDYLELTLVIDRFEPDARPVSLICGDREFSWLEYGEDIYASTARCLRAQREGKVDYPIYLTSLNCSGLPSLQPPGTVLLLELKKRVEQRLNRLWNGVA